MFSEARSESHNSILNIQSIPNAAPSWRARSRGIEYESGPGLNPREMSKSLGRFSFARGDSQILRDTSATNINFGSGQTIRNRFRPCEQSIVLRVIAAR